MNIGAGFAVAVAGSLFFSELAAELPTQLSPQLEALSREIGVWEVDGNAPHPLRLGLRLQPFVGTKQAVIAEVFADTPANKAGMKAGDIITEIDGKKVTGPESFTEVRRFNESTKVAVQFEHQGLKRTLQVETLAVRQYPARALVEASGEGSCVVARCAGTSLYYLDPVSGKVVWLSVGPKGEVSKGRFSLDDAKKATYSYVVETVSPNGTKQTEIKYVMWTGTDEKVEWFEPDAGPTSALLERQMVRYKRVK
jgi:membrane-associated protease RseP (regulator of RpoE activity)